MNINERRKYLHKMRIRYWQAQDKTECGKLLDEMQEVTGQHRKSLLRLMAEDEEPHNIPGAVEISSHVQDEIIFKNASFTYTSGKFVLENITLDIPARSVVALVGPTGVGKSTLVSLIPRFYDVTSGTITLDGRNVQEYKMDSLRQQISIVLNPREHRGGHQRQCDADLFHCALRRGDGGLRIGLVDRVVLELPVNNIASVASFFVSRLDTKLDPRLPEDSPRAEKPPLQTQRSRITPLKIFSPPRGSTNSRRVSARKIFIYSRQ